MEEKKFLQSINIEDGIITKTYEDKEEKVPFNKDELKKIENELFKSIEENMFIKRISQIGMPIAAILTVGLGFVLPKIVTICTVIAQIKIACHIYTTVKNNNKNNEKIQKSIKISKEMLPEEDEEKTEELKDYFTEHEKMSLAINNYLSNENVEKIEMYAKKNSLTFEDINNYLTQYRSTLTLDTNVFLDYANNKHEEEKVLGTKKYHKNVDKT